MNNLKYRTSKQREYLVEILKQSKDHPTASDIYDEMKLKFSNLSLGTVYRNLNILVEQKKILKLDFGSTFDHYDGTCYNHSHFICTKCNKVYDIFEDDVNSLDNIDSEHLIEGCIRKYYGICKNCIELQEKGE